jgi:hypothetical protein
MMSFVYVSNIQDIRSELHTAFFENVSSKITEKFLVSMINGYTSKKNHIFQLSKVAEKIQKLVNVSPGQVRPYIDSGGYSIITGEVPYERIEPVSDLYRMYLRSEPKGVYKIFTLDIPCNKMDDRVNTRTAIKKFNMLSLEKTKEVCQEKTSVSDRLMFVWHFKLKAQYRIFKKLYQELRVPDWTAGQAIGGMVGVRKQTGIKFSPFVGMAYECFWNYLKHGDKTLPFNLHFLGISNIKDRFIILLLEKIFERYCENAFEFDFTYDSVTPVQTTRTMPHFPIFKYDGETLKCYQTIMIMPPSLIDEIYTDAKLNAYVHMEYERRMNGERLANASTFGALSVKGHMDLDLFLSDIIDEYFFVDAVVQSESEGRLMNIAIKSFRSLEKKYPYVFSKKLCSSILETLSFFYLYNRWFLKDKSETQLDKLMLHVIKNINFPKIIT